MEPYHLSQALARLFVDPNNPLPAYAQLKDQIKFGCAYQEFRLGDVLPSIRVLARQLGVGDGVVRRAYRELRELAILGTEHRGHVVVTPALVALPEANALAQACAEECNRLIAWAGEKRLSTIALGRLLLRRALALEAASPSYLFVGICRLAAEESANKIAKAWEIKVTGVSAGDFANLSGVEVRHSSTALVNQYLYEDVMGTGGKTTQSVFPVRMRMEERLKQRVSRLPARSQVLLVFVDEFFPQTGRAVLRECEYVFGKKWRFRARRIGEVPDLTKLIRTQQYPLFLLSPIVWEQMPSRLKRMPWVARLVDEPDPRSLEETRISAGVLL